jgi:hypothetical protein
MSFFGNLFGGKTVKELKWTGKGYMDRGNVIFDAALKSLGDLDTTYTDLLRRGGLPEDVREGYRIQQGRISDETTRAHGAFAAELMQRARATGGRIDPQAAIDSQIEYDARTNDAAFNARNSIAFDEANRSLANTNAILEAIERIRGMKLGAGQNILGLGADLFSSSVSEGIKRRIALLGAATSLAGAAAGGAAAGGAAGGAGAAGGYKR